MKRVTILNTTLAGIGFHACCLPAAMAMSPKYKMTTDIPESITTPDKVETSIGTFDYFDGVPIKATTDTVYDYMDRARAVEVFVNLIPAVSMYHLRQGMRDIDLTNSNQILIARDMPDSKPLVLTWNNTSLYTWGFLDLKKDGPTVVEVPPGVLGVLNDMYFRYITDIGAAGADKGQGGKYLVLPPGYEGEVPDGYYRGSVRNLRRVEFHARLCQERRERGERPYHGRPEGLSAGEKGQPA